MTAHPRVGDAHRQEFWRGQAEDQYWMVELGASVTVPAGSYTDAEFVWRGYEYPGLPDMLIVNPGLTIVELGGSP